MADLNVNWNINLLLPVPPDVLARLAALEARVTADEQAQQTFSDHLAAVETRDVAVQAMITDLKTQLADQAAQVGNNPAYQAFLASMVARIDKLDNEAPAPVPPVIPAPAAGSTTAPATAPASTTVPASAAGTTTTNPASSGP